MAVPMYEDTREIVCLWMQEEKIAVGESGVRKIECYREMGQGSYIPWFAVYCNGEKEPRSRVNASSVDEVVYKGLIPQGT